MKSLRTFAPLALLTVLHVSTANAQWLFQTQENAFEPSKSMHIALTAAGDYALGLRCQNGEMSAIFITSETIEDVSVLNALKPELLIRIDQNEIFAFPTLLEARDNKLTASVTDEEKISSVFEEGKKAKKRISVAIKMLAETYHPTNFNVRGSTKSITELQANCGEN